MRSGDILFLTRRKKGNFIRVFISYMIAVFTKKKGQKLDDVKVHAAIIYKDPDTDKYKVRDMDKDGDDHYTVGVYKNIYGDRCTVKENPKLSDRLSLQRFNRSCKDTRVKYDFKNTFVWQVLKRYVGKFFGKDTKYSRMCIEDARRQYNVLVPKFFSDFEGTNPNEAWFELSEWKTYKI